MDKKRSGLSDILDWAGSFISNFLSATVQDVLEQLRVGMDNLIRRGVQTITGFMILVLGLVFLLIGLAQTISELMDMGSGIGYVITGVLTALFGVWIIERIQREK